jgi:hypothetical protein
MSETDNRDWRASAYLNTENWPEAIPWYGPKREYGPYPWGESDHYDPHNLDEYHWTHPDAGSCGDIYMGDVCPYCGVPLRLDETAVNINGREGNLHVVSPDETPVPSYHPECWKERQAEVHSRENQTLGDYA